MNYRKQMRLGLAVGSFLLAHSVFAAEAYRYGMAGCGLGSIAFKENTKSDQIGASFLDFPWPLMGLYYIGNLVGISVLTKVFAISSGTLNCQDLIIQAAAVDSFLDGNFSAIQNDSARGQGEAIDSLAKTLGCPDSKIIGAELQKNYSLIFVGGLSSPEEERNHAKRTIKKMVEDQLASQCGTTSS